MWCQIAGMDKPYGDLSDKERAATEFFEYKRWNTYKRSEGHIFSGNKSELSRNNMVRTHPKLVPFEELYEKENVKTV